MKSIARIRPRITIVTPVFNQVSFIEETINSVLGQNYSNLEYIIIDGGSTDGTVEIIKRYQDYLHYWISEPDNGMYDALNKGFEKSSGEIMGYINSDDILLPNALMTVAKIFHDNENIQWIHGLNTFLNEGSTIVHTQPAKRFSLLRYLMGDYEYIQQESCLWRKNLWEQAGGKFNSSLKLAGDFELWFRFFQFSTLYHCSIPIGGWRKRKDQLSALGLASYLSECNQIISNFRLNEDQVSQLNRVKNLKKIIRLLYKLKIFNSRYFEKKLYKAYNLQNTDLRYVDEIDRFIITDLNKFTSF